MAEQRVGLVSLLHGLISSHFGPYKRINSFPVSFLWILLRFRRFKVGYLKWKSTSQENRENLPQL